MGQRPSQPSNSFSSKEHDNKSAADSRSQTSSIEIPEETPSRPFMHNLTDQSEWNDCDVPVWTRDTKTQEDTSMPSPPNPFVYDGKKSANLTKRKNIILFGETGVGKSSVINLMAGAQVASTSSDLEGCTMEATEYSFTLPGEMSLSIYDTVGLNESEMGVNTFFGAIEKAHKLITSLHDAGGIDLLLFCIRGGRITATVERNYRLFFEFLCEKKVPLAFVVTHLEYEEAMEDWWKRNEKKFKDYGIQSVAHACVTAVPAPGTKLAAKRAESRSALHKMLLDSLSLPNVPYVKDIWGWFAHLVEMLQAFLMKGMPASFRKKDLSKRLASRCKLSRQEAERLADMLAKS